MEHQRVWRGIDAGLFRFTTTGGRGLHMALMAVFEDSAVTAPALDIDPRSRAVPSGVGGEARGGQSSSRPVMRATLGVMSSKFGVAAFVSEDVEDAHRRCPAVDPGEYAASRGLTPMGSVHVATVRSVQPAWPDYVFNVARGVLPGGRFGVLEHDLYEIATHPSTGIQYGGEFYGSRYNARGSRGFLNTLLPIELSHDEPAGPFAASAVWVPATSASVRVPEAALCPRLVVRRADRMGPVGNTDLDDVGLPGFRLGGRVVPDDLCASIFGGRVGEVFRRMPWPFVEVILTHGTLGVRCNGYLATADALDALAGAASSIAAGLSDVFVAYHAPRSVDTVLVSALDGPPDWAPWFPQPGPLWANTFRFAADKYGLALEEPTDLHRALPHFPMPGVTQGILRGVLPGAGVDGRLVFNAQGGATEGSMRVGVVIAASPGAGVDGRLVSTSLARACTSSLSMTSPPAGTCNARSKASTPASSAPPRSAPSAPRSDEHSSTARWNSVNGSRLDSSHPRTARSSCRALRQFARPANRSLRRTSSIPSASASGINLPGYAPGVRVRRSSWRWRGPSLRACFALTEVVFEGVEELKELVADPFPVASATDASWRERAGFLEAIECSTRCSALRKEVQRSFRGAASTSDGSYVDRPIARPVNLEEDLPSPRAALPRGSSSPALRTERGSWTEKQPPGCGAPGCS